MDQTSDLQLRITKLFGITADHSVEIYAGRLKRFLELYVRLPCLSAQAASELRKINDKLNAHVSSEKINFTRRDLYNSLTVEPFFSALQLIDVGINQEVVSQNFLLLAHLFTARGYDDYPAYLAFYKVINEATTAMFSRNFLENCTLDELRIEAQSLGDILGSKQLRVLAPFLRHRVNRALGNPRKSITSGVNAHEKLVEQTPSGNITRVEFSDEEGAQTSALLKLTPDLALSDAKQKSQFLKKQAGLQNALYNFESTTPWACHNATPAEITILLKGISEDLIDGTYNHLNLKTAGLLVILFLKLFGVANPEKLILINAGSPKFHENTPAQGSLIYEIDKTTQRLDAHIRFNAKLLTVRRPTCKDMRLHHIAREQVDIGLPYPIPQLLKQALQKIPATKRNHKDLFNALGVEEKQYRQWLRDHIKQSRLDAIGLTPMRMERAFEHFAKEHVPEVAFNYLSGKASVQHHYVSFERAEAERVLKSVWFDFLDEASIQRSSSNSDNFVTSFARAHHDTIGSSHVLRQEVLNAILAVCVRCASDESASPIKRLNSLALYTYIRIAATAALRPVSRPLPEHWHFHEALGLLSVADKRSHHKEERRLITLTESCTVLLSSFHQAINRISVRFNLPTPMSILMFYDLEANRWDHLSGKNASQMLTTIGNDTIENRSLRHAAASAFVSSHLNKFSQSAVNLLLNHVRANVSVLNRRSLITIESLAHSQRALIDEADFLSTYDTTVHQLLTSLGASA